MRELLSVAAAICLCSCVPLAREGLEPGDAGTSVVDGGGPDAGSPTACGDQSVRLLLVNYGDTDRYFVEVTYEGEQVAMQLDTGSSLNFLYQPANSPPYIPAFADVSLGCETVSVAARNIPSSGESVDGLPVVGTMGMELLLRTPSVPDIGGERLLRYAEWPEDLQMRASASFSYDNVIDHLLVPMTLDGDAVRMMFDTGGGHTLWVGVDGQPGDVEEQAIDAEGNLFSIFTGTGVVEISGEPAREIPVARAPTFPYFDETVAALGGNLHGLLGVTAFPNQALLFDDTADTVFVIHADALEF